MSDDLDLASLDPRVRWLIDEARQPVAMADDAKARLLDAVRRLPVPVPEPVSPPAWRWVVKRRTLRLSPLLGAALAAGLVGVGVVAGLLAPASRREAPELAASSSPSQLRAVSGPGTPHDVFVEPGVVKFVFVAPTASRVSLVGDFNAWDPERTPMARTGGTWTVTLPLEPGRHLYSFVVDGTQWLPDPSAPLAPEDGFGHSNSVVLVGASS